ncbi:hypothetical protein BH24PSE2_BH24PSE2_21540 [soil metagenome]
MSDTDTRSRRIGPGRLLRLASGLLCLGGLSGAVSLFVHLHWGHGPGTAAPMLLSAFFRAHPAFVAAGGLFAAAGATILQARAKMARHRLPDR